jgi:PKHD-type hydroxylase
MFLELQNLLGADELAQVRALAASARYVEGRVSNPHSLVKNNLQIDVNDPAFAQSSQLLAMALHRSEPFRNYAYPQVMAPPMLAKYRPGMTYGAHTDAAFLPIEARPLRSDLSCTIFIGDPASYEGGVLSIQLGTRTVEFKGPAGSAIVYPSTTLHEVTPVTAGERLVALTFIESLIPDPVLRDLLYQLDEVGALEGLNMSWENRTRLEYVRNNLKRMWGQPR